ncbi:MAG: D-tyrosyl-tRNA(Tyr) deacylase, partial [Woeseia sp.]|nr:D-tyrosyl-tRNA(Tyr) deacylase [Woeseia sp.]
MISLLQRVSEAKVTVANVTSGEIGRGLLVFTAIQPDDDIKKVTRMAARILTYRIFPDSEDRMNLSLVDNNLGLLIVPQFT